MQERMARLTQALAEAEIDALLLRKAANQRYLEGFTGDDCYMLVSGKGNFLIADSRYTEMGERECRTAQIRPHRPPHPPFGAVAAEIARDMGFSRLGFERESLLWTEHEALSEALCEAGVKLVPTSSLVEGIRAVKSPAEAAAIAAACQIADKALTDLLPLITPGVSELDLKTELDYRLKRGGAEDVSFDTMVLFGPRASQPHANARADVPLRPGDFILIDYGATKDGYHSDTTRTFLCGHASHDQRRAYETVLNAQQEALSMIRPGANGKDINDRALSVIQDAGFPAFGHGLGHGVGLEIHEQPTLRREHDVILEAGMTLTIEPGIYKPGWGGIRIEDTVLVTKDGADILTNFPKDLIEI